jgi:uncharacterized protein (TIGR00730 family)
MISVAVFCGAKKGINPLYQQVARELMQVFHFNNWRLVYGGAHIGLMGIMADELMELGGEVLGVIPEKIMDLELGHQGITELIKVPDMHTRKKVMYENAHAFVIFPGGIGTMDEFFEILTWKQLKDHSKPIAILNINHYYDPLLQWFDLAVREGFYTSGDRELFTVFHSLKEWSEAWGEAWKKKN